MTIFPNSPILLMNRIVLMDPVTSAVRRIIALQYNPASILRALQMQGVGGENGDRPEASRLKRSPLETIKVELKIDEHNSAPFAASPRNNRAVPAAQQPRAGNQSHRRRGLTSTVHKRYSIDWQQQPDANQPANRKIGVWRNRS